MKRFSFLTGVCLLPMLVLAQTPQWQWGRNGICTSLDAGYSVVIDKENNIYAAGVFTNTLLLDTISLHSFGNTDIFIAKYNPLGQILWAISGGSNAGESVGGIVTDSVGNIYLVGKFGSHTVLSYSFTDTAYFSGNNIISKGGEDVCLIKYNKDGILQWIKSYGSEYDDAGIAINLTNSQKILITGSFSGYNGSPPVYGTIGFDSIYLTSAGDGDIFMTCSDTGGNIEWGKRYGSKLGEYTRDIKVDIFDNIYLTGSFNNKIIFDSDSIMSISSGFVIGDVFVSKFDKNGNILWTRPIGGANAGNSAGGAVVSAALSVVPSGNFYLTGNYFHCSLKFHNGSSLPYEDQFKMFVAKYDMNGNYVWAKKAGGISSNGSSGMWLDKNENIYITGDFYDEVIFDNDTITGFGYEDAFIVKYNQTGNKIWSLNMGGPSHDFGYGISGNIDGDIYVTGAFESNAFIFGTNMLTNNGNSDFFLVKLLQSTTGIPELTNKENEVTIYPNPAADALYIRAKNKFSRIIIYDPTGRVVQKQNNLSGKNNMEIATSGLPNGIYYLQLSGNKNTVTQKIIIHH